MMKLKPRLGTRFYERGKRLGAQKRSGNVKARDLLARLDAEAKQPVRIKGIGKRLKDVGM